MSQILYTSAIGSTMYVMLFTQIDVSYVLSIYNRYQSNPSEGHWMTIKNILKYLKKTKNAFLVYERDEELTIKEYIDIGF